MVHISALTVACRRASDGSCQNRTQGDWWWNTGWRGDTGSFERAVVTESHDKPECLTGGSACLWGPWGAATCTDLAQPLAMEVVGQPWPADMGGIGFPKASTKLWKAGPYQVQPVVDSWWLGLQQAGPGPLCQSWKHLGLNNLQLPIQWLNLAEQALDCSLQSIGSKGLSRGLALGVAGGI